MQECINFHLIIGDKLCPFITDLLTNLMVNLIHLSKNLKLNLDKATTYNPFLIAVLGDFNAELCNWCINDKTNFKGAKSNKLTSRNRLHQIIKKPTHILDISFSCIDLFFTSQPKLVMDSGVHVSLHVNCHHQIIFPKFDFQIY